jgi:hypothetical protein
MSSELHERLLDVAPLLLEVGDLVVDLVERELEVSRRDFTALLGDHGADFRQGEAELLALEDDGKSGAIAGVIDASRALARGERRPRSS